MSFDKKTARYYRDGGQWDATIKIRGEKMSGKINYTGSKFKAVECTFDEWRENNGLYGNWITEDYDIKEKKYVPSDDDLPY